MTKEQVLDISKTLFGMPRYQQNFALRARLARRMFQLKREIAENATNVQATKTLSLP